MKNNPETNDKALTLASRSSMLALWQANFVAEQLKSRGQSVNIKTWKTTGDIVQDRFLHEIGGKGLFIKELEEAMLRGDADFAVHSLKDMPAQIPEGFCLAAVLPRHSSRDTIIFREDFWKSMALQPGIIMDAPQINLLGPMVIATSSLRRRSLLASSCPNVSTVPIRGNVDTRLKKLKTEAWDAIILAEASLDRLGLDRSFAHPLDPSWFIPCPGQGALAIESPIQGRANTILKTLECDETRRAINIERRILARLGGDCTMPFGCLVQRDLTNTSIIHARAIVLSNDGNFASAEVSNPIDKDNIERYMEEQILTVLRQNGANKILESLGIRARI